MNAEPSLLIIFFSGILSFFSPCMLPIVPVYLSYISGVGVNEVNNNQIRVKVLLNSIFFVLGFSVVFILMQIAAVYFANFISHYIANDIVYKIAGAFVILLGLNMSGIITLNFLFKEHKLKSNLKPRNIFISFLLGFIFGIGWSPCVGPILYSVIAYISKVETVERGILYILIYCIGMGVPFLITGFFMDYFLRFSKKITKYGKAVEIFSGVILILMGAALFFNKMGAISSYLN